MIRTTRATIRRGFTLVELLVAAAVCVLIMAVLATAFQLGIDTMRQMKSTGDLVDQLRGATEVLRTDLKSDHFLDDGKVSPPRIRVRDIRFDRLSWTVGNGTLDTTDPTAQPASAGFFRARSSPIPAAQQEGADSDALLSSRATDHYLHFTSILPPGDGPEDNYTATAGGRTVQSRAAEVAYFLEGTGFTTTGTTSIPIYRLIRRQRLAALNQTELQTRWLGVPLDPPVISLAMPADKTYGNVPNTLADLTNPFKRLGGTAWVKGVQVGPGYGVTGSGDDSTLAPLTSRPGDDILLSNVISFEVQLSWEAAPAGNNIPTIRNPDPFNPNGNVTGYPIKTDYPFDTLPKIPTDGKMVSPGPANTSVPDYVFDTWSDQMTGWNTVDVANSTTIPSPKAAYASTANTVPYPIRVLAVQIKIRVWDPKLQNARQMTIVQDL
jgi:type II secretory pathway pseudopilin PulG